MHQPSISNPFAQNKSREQPRPLTALLPAEKTSTFNYYGHG